MTVRHNNAEGCPTGVELVVGDTAGASGDQFSSITRTVSGSLQATATSPIDGTKSYLVTNPSASSRLTVNYNETTYPPSGGWVASFAVQPGMTGSVALLAIRGSAGSMVDLVLVSTGALNVLDAAGSAIITVPAGTVPRDGTTFTVALEVDPGTGTTDGRARLAVWVAGVLVFLQEVTGRNTYRAGGITSRRWGVVVVTGISGTVTMRADGLHTIDGYTSGVASAAGQVSISGTATADGAPAGVDATAAGTLSITGSARAAADYDIVLLVGQSNMRGAAQDYDSSDAYPANVDTATWSGNTISAIRPAAEPLPSRDTGTGMGAGNRFVRLWANSTARRVLVVNAARGGTGFSLPSSGTDALATWDVDAVDDSHNLGWTTIRAMQDALVRFPGSRIVAVLANHGSTDGTNGQSAAVTKARYLRWIDTLRAQLGIHDVPYLMMQMRPDLLANQANMRALDDAQIAITTERAHTGHGTSPTGAGYYMADAVHFNAAGLRLIGSGLYDLLPTVAGNGAAQSSGTLTLTGDAAGTGGGSGSSAGGLTITGQATAVGQATAAGTVAITAEASAAGQASALGALAVTGSSASAGQALAAETLTLTGQAAGTGQGAAAGTTAIIGQASAGGQAAAAGTITITGRLGASSAGAASGTLTITGASTGQGQASAAGTLSITGTVAASGGAAVFGALLILGAAAGAAQASASGTLTLSGAARSVSGWRDVTITAAEPVRSRLTATEPSARLNAAEPHRTLITATERQP